MLSELPVRPTLFPDESAKVLAGKKQTHRCDDRLYLPGETFSAAGGKIRVGHVYRQALIQMTEADARSEGYDSLAAFRFAYLLQHPGLESLRTSTVWVHELLAV